MMASLRRTDALYFTNGLCAAISPLPQYFAGGFLAAHFWAIRYAPMHLRDEFFAYFLLLLSETPRISR